jgi:hypothetical protein
MMMQVLSASRLDDGLIVFYGSAGTWVEGLQQALVLEDKAALEAALARARQDVAANRVMEIVPMDITREAGLLVPVSLRDRIRAAGPTVRLDTGKQAAGL